MRCRPMTPDSPLLSSTRHNMPHQGHVISDAVHNKPGGVGALLWQAWKYVNAKDTYQGSFLSGENFFFFGTLP